MYEQLRCADGAPSPGRGDGLPWGTIKMIHGGTVLKKMFMILLAALLLPLDCARVGIFALAFGDGLASLMGKLFGKITIPGAHGKTAAGSLTCFFAVFISTFCCCGDCFISLCVALCAMFIEILPLSDFDNLIIPPAIGLLYMSASTALIG